VKKLASDAELPEYALGSDVGFDLRQMKIYLLRHLTENSQDRNCDSDSKRACWLD